MLNLRLCDASRRSPLPCQICSSNIVRGYVYIGFESLARIAGEYTVLRPSWIERSIGSNSCGVHIISRLSVAGVVPPEQDTSESIHCYFRAGPLIWCDACSQARFRPSRGSHSRKRPPMDFKLRFQEAEGNNCADDVQTTCLIWQCSARSAAESNRRAAKRPTRGDFAAGSYLYGKNVRTVGPSLAPNNDSSA